MFKICLARECFREIGINCAICDETCKSGLSCKNAIVCRETLNEQGQYSDDQSCSKDDDINGGSHTSVTGTEEQSVVDTGSGEGFTAAPVQVILATAERLGSSGRLFGCPFCTQRFEAESAANAHMVAVHEVPTGVQCPIPECKAVVSRARYKSHMMIVHRSQVLAGTSGSGSGHLGPLITCPQCLDKQFLSASGLRRHMRKEHERRRVQCPECGLHMLETSLRQHVKLHAPEHTWQHACPYFGCEKRYASPLSLRNHVKSVHEREKYEKYRCKNCHKAFLTPAKAEVHHVACAALRRFECHICYRSYSHKGTLSKHLREKHDRNRFIMV